MSRGDGGERLFPRGFTALDNRVIPILMCLGWTATRVYIAAVKDHRNRVKWTTTRQLAELAHAEQAQVVRSLRQLENLGLLRCTRAPQGTLIKIPLLSDQDIKDIEDQLKEGPDPATSGQAPHPTSAPPPARTSSVEAFPEASSEPLPEPSEPVEVALAPVLTEEPPQSTFLRENGALPEVQDTPPPETTCTTFSATPSDVVETSLSDVSTTSPGGEHLIKKQDPKNEIPPSLLPPSTPGEVAALQPPPLALLPETQPSEGGRVSSELVQLAELGCRLCPGHVLPAVVRWLGQAMAQVHPAPSPTEMTAFLRWASQEPSLNTAKVRLAAACRPERFVPWLQSHRAEERARVELATWQARATVPGPRNGPRRVEGRSEEEKRAMLEGVRRAREAAEQALRSGAPCRRPALSRPGAPSFVGGNSTHG